MSVTQHTQSKRDLGVKPTFWVNRRSQFNNLGTRSETVFANIEAADSLDYDELEGGASQYHDIVENTCLTGLGCSHWVLQSTKW